MPSNSQESKYSLSYIYRALEDSYFAAAFIALRSASFGDLALMIGTEIDYIVLADYVFSSLLLDILLSMYYKFKSYQKSLKCG